VPPVLAVGATYGMTVLVDAKPAASRFAEFVLSDDGRRILAKHGFDAP
jgi:molybdate transport system substrate-binding protein